MLYKYSVYFTYSSAYKYQCSGIYSPYTLNRILTKSKASNSFYSYLKNTKSSLVRCNSIKYIHSTTISP